MQQFSLDFVLFLPVNISHFTTCSALFFFFKGRSGKIFFLYLMRFFLYKAEDFSEPDR